MGIKNILHKTAASYFSELKGQCQLWQYRVEGRQNLAKMDARLLKDIGLTESDRLREISKPFWQE
ncbi:DUF1127 domain-containing protein [Endozoicomonas sp.]|uniref:DUF1127 domain-containing protein n=1 Tax=Endozoicomonas sp. TaxID=1892382 RepID=UPI00383AC73F